MTKRKRRSSEPETGGTGWAPSERGLTEGQRRILAWAGSIGSVLAIALLFTLVVRSASGSQATPAPESESMIGQDRPSAYQPWPSPKEFAPLADRKADAKPLTAQEIFGPRTFTADKVTLRRVAAHLDSSCAGAVWGAELADALADAGCTQAVRGLYATQDGVYVAQYTLFNLTDVKAANDLVQNLATLYRGGWVLPLKSSKAAFGVYSEGSAQAMGHYVGLVWIGRSDGDEPGAKDNFVLLSLAVRDAEKAIYRRVVTVAGVPNVAVNPGSPEDMAPGAEPAPTEQAPTDPLPGQTPSAQPASGQPTLGQSPPPVSVSLSPAAQ
jgi:hypothetical protein